MGHTCDYSQAGLKGSVCPECGRVHPSRSVRPPRPVLAVLSALLAASSFAAMVFMLVVPYGLIFAIVPLLPVTVLFAIDAFCLARGSRSAGVLAIIALCMVVGVGGVMLWNWWGT